MLEFLNLDNQYCIAQNCLGTHIKLDISKHLIFSHFKIMINTDIY